MDELEVNGEAVQVCDCLVYEIATHLCERYVAKNHIFTDKLDFEEVWALVLVVPRETGEADDNSTAIDEEKLLNKLVLLR